MFSPGSCGPSLPTLLVLGFTVLNVVLAESRLAPRHATIVDRQTVNSNYTFIIAGGGTAGLTLADRLTENPSGGSKLHACNI